MNIISPPYAKKSASPRMLYQALKELYAWAESQLEWGQSFMLDLHVKHSLIPRELNLPASIISEDRFVGLSLVDMYTSWNKLRYIRERYDDIVRNYEQTCEWESDDCKFLRLTILKLSCDLLNVAFLDFERREAKEQSLWKEEIEKIVKRTIDEIKKTSSFDWKMFFDDRDGLSQENEEEF